MKNWRTTLAGVGTGLFPFISALVDAYNAGYFTESSGSKLWIGIGLILFGVLAKDKNVTGVGKDAQTKDEIENK